MYVNIRRMVPGMHWGKSLFLPSDGVGYGLPEPGCDVVWIKANTKQLGSEDPKGMGGRASVGCGRLVGSMVHWGGGWVFETAFFFSSVRAKSDTENDREHPESPVTIFLKLVFEAQFKKNELIYHPKGNAI